MKMLELLTEKKSRKKKSRKTTSRRKNMYTNSFRTPVTLGFGGWYWGGVNAPGDNSDDGDGGDGGGE